MKTYTVLPGRCIAIDGLASVTIGIVIADKISGLRAIEPADADALTRHIVDLLNGDVLAPGHNAKIDERIARIKEGNTYRGRVTNYGEERAAIVESVRGIFDKP